MRRRIAPALAVLVSLTVLPPIAAAAGGPMKGILGIETAELVSSDYRGDSRSSIVDAPLTRVVNNNCVKVIAWYDN